MTIEQRYTAELVRLRNAQLRLAIEEHRKNIMALGLGSDGKHGGEFDRRLWTVLDDEQSKHRYDGGVGHADWCREPDDHEGMCIDRLVERATHIGGTP